MISHLPTLNAALNGLATLLLVAGYIFIRRGNVAAHRRCMLTAFGVSIAFLASYLTYHFAVGHVKYCGPPSLKTIYFLILITHVLLAATVPVLAARTIQLGLTGQNQRHRRWAKWTWPIWLYVSVTGVVIYFMLYHLSPGDTPSATIEAKGPTSTSETER
jgi:uncharacterized membrane protein YozB (DUF420 family)